MRFRVAAVFGIALFVAAWLPGPAAGNHDSVSVEAETPNLAEPFEHKFTPENIQVEFEGEVWFTNTDGVNGVFAPPHTWTLLVDGCDPSVSYEGCETYGTDRLSAGGFAVIHLEGLDPGEYDFVCAVGQPGDPGGGDEDDGDPFSDLEPVFSEVEPVLSPVFHAFGPHPHATKNPETGEWTGMVGTLEILAPPLDDPSDDDDGQSDDDDGPSDDDDGSSGSGGGGGSV